VFKSILVPLDGSELAECSLKHVQAIAQGCQVPSVTLLTIIEPIQSFITEPPSETKVKEMFQGIEQIQAQALDNANKYLAKASGRLSKENIDTKTDIVQAPENEGVAEVILEYAKNSSIDLIIMSTHGRSGISRWTMGSVADRIVRSSIVPVLIVAPAGCKQ
jgi:nucleotide-binding universal stress UspA family protein